MVLKSNILTSASPWWELSQWGLRVTQDAYFSLLAHTKQLSLVTFYKTTAGSESVIVRDARARQDKMTYGRTDLKVEIAM